MQTIRYLDREILFFLNHLGAEGLARGGYPLAGQVTALPAPILVVPFAGPPPPPL